MTTLAAAIRRARLDRKLTQADLARIAGVTKGAISQWETGRGSPDKRHITLLATTLGLPIHLLLGADVETKGNISPVRDESRRWVPVISWASAGKGALAVDPYPAGVGVEYLEVSGEYSASSYALELRGDSMLPEFADGDIVIIDPTLTPHSDCYVIAELLDPTDIEAAGEVTCKQYKPRGIAAYDLVPANPAYATRTVNATQPGRIVGVVVEHRRRLV